MRGLVVGGAIATVLSLMPMNVSAHQQQNIAPNGRVPIAECISKDKKLDVLFVVDQSISLKRNLDRSPGTDPNDERVTALKAVLNVLRTKTDGDIDDRPVEVTVAHSGFGEGFVLHKDWMKLDEDGFKAIVEEFDLQADRDSEDFTRYHRALEGAVATFNKRSSGDGTCRMMVWISDGKHDDDNKGQGFSSGEQRQIREMICGSGGLADELRTNGIFTVAAGLNEDESQLELMKLVSRRSGSLPLGGTPMLTECGSLPAYGEFQVARNADQLVETLFNLVNTTPGGKPLSPTESRECADGTPDCSEISFEATSLVDEFTMLIDRKVSTVDVELRTGPGKRHELFGSEPLTDANAKASILSTNRLYLDVQRRQNGSIDGIWTVRFLGTGNRSASALVKFVGKSIVEVESETDAGDWSPLVEIDRYNTRPVRIKARIAESEIQMDALTVYLRPTNSDNGASLVELSLSSNEGDAVLLSADVLQEELSKGELSRVTKAELVVRIAGFIPGLIDSDTGTDVPVEFPDETVEFRVGNGSEWPRFVEQIEVPKIVGTDKQTVRMLFKGADGRATEVTFDDELDSDLGLEFVSGQNCPIPASEVTECVLEVKPDKSSFGRKTFPAGVIYSDGSGQTLPQDIDVTIDMEKPTSAGDGLIAALVLVLLFLLLQGIQRYFFAVLMSRFAKLNATDRRARLDIEISDSGHITGPNGSVFSIKPNDEGFVYENFESNSGFYLFGYEFDTSVTRTFLHATNTPRGLVSQEGKYVFGSAGVQISRKSAESSLGLVNLSLRGQWVIGINRDEILKLADGVSIVSAELVVYLDPIERNSLEQQLSDLNFDIAGGQFAHEFSSVISTVREQAQVVRSADGSQDFNSDTPWDLGAPFVAFNDPFSDMDGVGESGVGDPESRKSRFSMRRGKKHDEATANDQGAERWTDPNDPFA